MRTREQVEAELAEAEREASVWEALDDAECMIIPLLDALRLRAELAAIKQKESEG
jgi:hypothetical protein